MEPIVAIIGRPNVGKSTLFNRIIGKKQAIVASMSGVTRDRHYGKADWVGRTFVLIDTGGIDTSPNEKLSKLISDQSFKAISEADVLICVLDATVEISRLDYDLIDKLRKQKKPVIYALNKVDGPKQEFLINDFYKLGVDDIFAISAEHGRSIDDLLDKLIECLPGKQEEDISSGDAPFVAVIGRPNVGKSTLINQIAGEERVVASEIPGTTRDAIDVDIQWKDKHYIFIDTGGLKKKRAMVEVLDKVTIVKTLHSVERAKVICLLLDASEGLTRQDLNLASFAYEEGKGVIVLINKWDLMKKANQGDYEKYIIDQLKELRDLPILFVSALTGKGCANIFDQIDKLLGLLQFKIGSSELNSIIENVVKEHNIPMYKSKQVKFYYGTQVNTYPPTILIFSNYPEGISKDTRKFVTNRIKSYLGLENIPLRIVFKKRV